ncbi:RNA polymerase sigma factor [Pelagicoccus sp. SDUM812003]|uniref:RNA polymerase sigma factor n=1 Tax=Pelagicoccus sp. SDUM812003 TaxID=3041267 RepID=UPI00280F78B7|nr:RNA polymerase sigma factor [Pelagicoccus sp. SDUM812003]MDQ8203532.1 RNA polymerase sigma factor [Pelagicoccus sp. SDUM812003]
MTFKRQKRIFDDWLDEHSAVIFKVVRAYAFSPHDRDDLFQVVVLEIWRSIPKFEGKSKETTWLYRISLYAALAWSRKEKRAKERISEANGTAGVYLQANDKPNRRVDWLYERIAKLEAVDRSLTLLMLDGYSYREISDIVGLTESSVGARLSRIRKKLTEQLEKEDGNGL